MVLNLFKIFVIKSFSDQAVSDCQIADEPKETYTYAVGMPDLLIDAAFFIMHHLKDLVV